MDFLRLERGSTDVLGSERVSAAKQKLRTTDVDTFLESGVFKTFTFWEKNSGILCKLSTTLYTISMHWIFCHSQKKTVLHMTPICNETVIFFHNFAKNIYLKSNVKVFVLSYPSVLEMYSQPSGLDMWHGTYTLWFLVSVSVFFFSCQFMEFHF